MKQHHGDDHPSRLVQEEIPLPRPDQLHIFLLGGFRVRVGLRWISSSDWYLRKPQSLLKLLALAPEHRLHQGELIALLWPGLDRPGGLQILTKALTLVQRVLERNLPVNLPSTYLHWDEDVVELGPPGRVWVDVEAFTNVAQRAVRTWDPADCDQAIRLYRGDLLPEDRFESWTVEPREQLKGLRLSLASCQETAV